MSSVLSSLKNIFGYLLVIVAAALLGACGGGGSGSTQSQDTQEPGITYTVPDNYSTGVVQKPTLNVTFSEEIDPATINATTFILKDSGNNSITGTISYNAMVATFTPSAGLSYSSTYTATVTTGVKDVAGNNMASDYSWSFTTMVAPHVTSTYPASGQSNVLASSVITVSFSKPMNPATINSSTFSIVDTALNPVAGTVVASGTTATFTPSSPLNYSMTYTATLDSSITDTATNSLASDYVWSFSTPNVLGNAINISSSSDNASCPSAVFDTNNNAYVAWNQGPNNSSSVWTNQYRSASGWDTAVTIESGLDNIWGCPTIKPDSNGNVIAVWSQSGVIMLNRYVNGSGWSTPEIVGGSAGLSPSVAVDSTGNIIVVWEESRSILARRYEVGVGWGIATTIESYSSEAYSPSIVIDSSGNATVVWSQQVSGTLFSATANHYTVGSGWGTPVTISSGLAGLLNNLVAVSIDASGNVIAAWSQGSTTFIIRANRYVPGSGWGTPVVLDSDLSTTSLNPNLATFSNDAVVVWGKSNQKTIYVAKYASGSGWGTATTIAVGASYPKIAINNTGKITVAWNHEYWNGDSWEYGVRATQYTSLSGWEDVVLLVPNNSSSSGLDLVADGLGNFLAAWTDGSNVFGNIFQ
jgi:hypothetical protein